MLHSRTAKFIVYTYYVWYKKVKKITFKIMRTKISGEINLYMIFGFSYFVLNNFFYN